MLPASARTLVRVVLLIALVLQGCSSEGENVTTEPESDPAPGVSAALAAQRAARLIDIRYEYALTIPPSPAEPILGRAVLRFALADAGRPLVIDFAPGDERIEAVAANGREAGFRTVNGHIVIPSGALESGENAIEIDFRAGDGPLNRNAEFLYSLFVPARGHHALPLFDQPDLKARFSLELTVPATWEAVSNGAEVSREREADAIRIRYAETAPIPSYLFGFAAGRFSIETAERNGREYRMLHRETDAAKVERNRDAAFDLHAAALEWLERYTGIDYPFGKFDFILIPAFQFNGMEHPGAIYYRDSSILLDESATENDYLGRASVIAHETAHMWFGDLVTMRWFDDVWMKEVFANFMAAKIVNPSFPDVNHDLRFLLAHHPRAYSVDRTAGTHPIRQPLANLDDAGSLYGPIIYQKAPVVMRQLELLVGEEAFRDGLRAYLEQYAFGNASWLDLVELLDARADFDVAEWSRAWVEEAGRPSIVSQVEHDDDGRIQRISFTQTDPEPDRNLLWRQRMNVLTASPDGTRQIPLELDERTVQVPAESLPAAAELVLPAAAGLAYGGFELDPRSRERLLETLPALDDPVARGAAWLILWDEMLDDRARPEQLIDLALRALPVESTEQNILFILDVIRETFWSFLSLEERAEAAPALEALLRDQLAAAPSQSLKAAWFTAFRSIVTTPDGVAFLERVWQGAEPIEGLSLSETDEADIAAALAIRGVPSSAAILEAQRDRFENPDRRARFEFVMPALSGDDAIRDAFFASLAEADNRRREPWVADALAYLNHPLRGTSSEAYIRPALELLPEIQRTGDIFFPKNWTDALLDGHRTPSAAATVRDFLERRDDLPLTLRRVILQSADELFRAANRPGAGEAGSSPR